MCKCSPSDLLNYGCQCGGFINESCGVWFNGIVYVIAKNAQDANQFAFNDATNIQWLVGDGQGWRRLPDNELITFEFPDGKSSMTADGWTQIYGPGFLASI